VDGEKLRIVVRKPESFAKALGVTGTADVARRVTDAREQPADTDRLRPVLAIGLIAGLMAVAAIGLWVTGLPPFSRTPSKPIIVVSRTQATPPPQQNFTKATIATPTTRAPSALEKAEVFWEVHVALWQEGDDGDGGILGYIDRAIDAAYRSDWGEMGAECIVAQPMAEMAAVNSKLAPTTAVRDLSVAYWDEIQELLFWCARGTSAVSDQMNTSLDIASSLNHRVEDAMKQIGVGIDPE
jgi:hypothetical protein